MARELTVTEDEMRQALREALNLIEDMDPNSFTVRELAEMLEISEWKARQSVRGAVEAGTMERVLLRRRRTDGRLYTVPGVRLVE